jgi:superfamily I DNA and/or RNA helicase
LFSNTPEFEEEDAVKGIVNQVRESEMIITLYGDELPDWTYGGYLGVQALFDEVSYREMEQTMTILIDTEDKRINELKSILLGNSPARFTTDLPFLNDPLLNIRQNEAFRLVNSALDVAIIHGPPGTGKTTTLVETILYILREEEQVLVCAPSNAAVDLLVEKLDQKQTEVLRIGNPSRVTTEMLSKTLDARIAHHPYYKELKSLRRRTEEYKSLARKYKRNFGKAEREQRKLLFDEAGKLRAEADQLEFYISNDIISKSRVIAATLVGANNYVLKGRKFRTVFIDEAAQALEPACWIPILKADRVVFAGDHCQLPPTIKSIDAARAGLDQTLFEKAIIRTSADVMLNEQYRMNKQIMEFSSRIFYNNQLLANGNIADATLFQEDMPVEFIDTAGTGFLELKNEDSFSITNPEEAHILLKHLVNYVSLLDSMNLLPELRDIGIISPYKAQTSLLQEIVREGSPEVSVLSRISINTVDSFQGQERDVIYISLVRSNEEGAIGFLADTRRMNVAMTRARKKLVIFGDSSTIGNHPFYNALLDYVNEKNAYRSAFEFM